MKIATADGAAFQSSSEAAARRLAVELIRQGVLCETMPRGSSSTGSAETSGRLHGFWKGFAKGDVVTGIAVESTAVGVGITLAKVALIDLGGVVRALSASVHADWIAATGTKPVPLLATYTVPDDDVLALCHLQVSGTSCATLARGAGLAATGGGPIGTGLNMGFLLNAQADFPAVGSSLSVATLNNVKHYMAAF